MLRYRLHGWMTNQKYLLPSVSCSLKRVLGMDISKVPSHLSFLWVYEQYRVSRSQEVTRSIILPWQMQDKLLVHPLITFSIFVTWCFQVVEELCQWEVEDFAGIQGIWPGFLGKQWWAAVLEPCELLKYSACAFHAALQGKGSQASAPLTERKPNWTKSYKSFVSSGTFKRVLLESR